jgi:hypothetical protein
MRIWDVNPGYLNNHSLLGEHRELHGILSILLNDKKGYSKHPETIRWKCFEQALCRRHSLLVFEMNLRNIIDRSPLGITSDDVPWPPTYIDPPGDQFAILGNKYKEKSLGRIPLPGKTHELWAHHKYSVMARSLIAYKSIGKEISKTKGKEGFGELALRLAELLRVPPSPGNLKNALEHMWGHVSDISPDRHNKPSEYTRLLSVIRMLAVKHGEQYLISSTALGELAAWSDCWNINSG